MKMQIYLNRLSKIIKADKLANNHIKLQISDEKYLFIIKDSCKII